MLDLTDDKVRTKMATIISEAMAGTLKGDALFLLQYCESLSQNLSVSLGMNRTLTKQLAKRWAGGQGADSKKD